MDELKDVQTREDGSLTLTEENLFRLDRVVRGCRVDGTGITRSSRLDEIGKLLKWPRGPGVRERGQPPPLLEPPHLENDVLYRQRLVLRVLDLVSFARDFPPVDPHGEIHSLRVRLDAEESLRKSWERTSENNRQGLVQAYRELRQMRESESHWQSMATEARRQRDIAEKDRDLAYESLQHMIARAESAERAFAELEPRLSAAERAAALHEEQIAIIAADARAQRIDATAQRLFAKMIGTHGNSREDREAAVRAYDAATALEAERSKRL